VKEHTNNVIRIQIRKKVEYFVFYSRLINENRVAVRCYGKSGGNTDTGVDHFSQTGVFASDHRQRVFIQFVEIED